MGLVSWMSHMLVLVGIPMVMRSGIILGIFEIVRFIISFKSWIFRLMIDKIKIKQTDYKTYNRTYYQGDQHTDKVISYKQTDRQTYIRKRHTSNQNSSIVEPKVKLSDILLDKGKS